MKTIGLSLLVILCLAATSCGGGGSTSSTSASTPLDVGTFNATADRGPRGVSVTSVTITVGNHVVVVTDRGTYAADLQDNGVAFVGFDQATGSEIDVRTGDPMVLGLTVGGTPYTFDLAPSSNG